MKFFERQGERLYPVGRLDYQSEGLLLVTNDGPLANQLTRAASGVEKTYLVKISGTPSEEALEKLRGGVAIAKGKPAEGRVRTSPTKIRLVRAGENPWYEIVLIEGRNRELRKMFEEIGHRVEKIRRVAYGPLVLDIDAGTMRELHAEEVDLLRRAAAGKYKSRKIDFSVLLPKEAGRSVDHEAAKERVKRPYGKNFRFDNRGPGRSQGRGESTGQRRDESRGFDRRPGGKPAFGRPGFSKDRADARPEGHAGVHPGEQSGERPGMKPAFGRSGFSKDRPDARPGTRGGERSGERTGGRPAFGRPAYGKDRPDARTGGRSGERPGRKPAFGRTGFSTDRPDARPGGRGGERSGERPARTGFGKGFGGAGSDSFEKQPPQRPVGRRPALNIEEVGASGERSGRSYEGSPEGRQNRPERYQSRDNRSEGRRQDRGFGPRSSDERGSRERSFGQRGGQSFRSSGRSGDRPGGFSQGREGSGGKKFGSRTEGRSAGRSGDRPERGSGFKSDFRSGDRPAFKREFSSDRSDSGPADRSSGKPAFKSGFKSGGKPGFKSGPRAGSGSGGGSKPGGSRGGFKSGSRPGFKSGGPRRDGNRGRGKGI
jgi:23S rRNA pseudouridine2605 synthase